MADEPIKVRPQPGPQRQFLTSPADIVIYGGSAGGGKSWSLLFEAVRHIHNPQFTAVIFRRTTPELTNPGGLWDESLQMYPLLGGIGSRHTLRWVFPSGATVKFSHMEQESDRFNWQGSQVTLIGFDELAHFTAPQFWYMLSRNRSVSGIKPYMRATTNPDPDSFVARLIEWWIDQETGLAIKERSGVVRWFWRVNDDTIEWGDSAAELIERYGPDCQPKSLTFIPASIQDNRILLEKDPSYLANLKALTRVDRERLLGGNWKIRPAAGLFFKREWFEIVDAAPADVERCRYWDRASSKPPSGADKKKGRKPDWTAGVRLARTAAGLYFVEDVRRMQETPLAVNQAMRNTALQDPAGTAIRYNKDPASAGDYEAQDCARFLEGFDVRFEAATGDKVTRAKPVSAQCEAGNVKLVRGPWLEPFLNELENFPDGANDDQVDGLSGAFNELANRMRIFFA